MREFGIVHDTFPGSEDLYKNRAEGSIAGLTDEQREKLFGILDPKTETVVAEVVPEAYFDGQITIDGDVTQIRDNIPQDKRENIEAGIQYILKKGAYTGDLVLGKWLQNAPIGAGFHSRIGGHTSLHSYNIIEQGKSSPNTDPNKDEYLLLLRVKPDSNSTQKATLVPHLLEIPGNSGLVKYGFAFGKDLTSEEFLDYLAGSKVDIAQAA